MNIDNHVASVPQGGLYRAFRCSILSLLLTIAGAISLQAGGPLSANGTTPQKYPTTAIPLIYRTDLGALGNFSNNVAVSIADYAFNQWANVTTASLSFTNAGTLTNNVTTATDPYISGVGQFSDGINPIVFNSDGSITDAKLGIGAKNSVYGFSSSGGTPTSLVEGYVIINGFLSGTGSTAEEDQFKAVITHEVGHFLGLGHSQVGMHAVFATMYPSIETIGQKTLEADDKAAISLLYPATGYPSSVGSISGTVKTPGNAILSGLNVVAVNTVSGNSYSTVVDYFSGGGPTFSNQPTASGSYTISGLPPGKYCVRIEPLNSYFTGGSSIASYNTPVNTGVAREWYNGGVESGDMLLDNTNEMLGVTVAANSTTSGINFISNESNTLSTLSYDNGTHAVTFSLPQNPADAQGVRYTAPLAGSLLGVKLYLLPGSDMPTTGILTVSVYSNITGGIAGIPGTLLGSVQIPFKFLEAEQDNEIWLRGIGTPVNFTAGTNFHVVLTTNNVGHLDFPGDDGVTTQNRSSYHLLQGGWSNYPQGGFAAGYNIMMKGIYTTSNAGVVQPLASVSPNSIDFGKKRPGQTVDKTVTISNPGTAALNITSTSITGANVGDYSIISGGGATLVPIGQSRQIVLRFAPTNAGGLKSAALTIATNAPGSPVNVPLSGSGVQPVAARLMPAIQLGERRTGIIAVIDTLVIQNTGTDTLRISSASITGADSAAIKLFGVTSAVVLPNAYYKAKLRFSPQQRRVFNARLHIVHDDPTGTSDIDISGTGVAPIVTAALDTFKFGKVHIGTTASTTDYYVRNWGDAPLLIGKMELVGYQCRQIASHPRDQLPDYDSACGASVPVEVHFTPDQRRAYTATLRVTHDGLEAVTYFTFTGSGTNGILSVPSTYSFGQISVGTSSSGWVALRNIGNEPLKVTDLAISGTDAADFTMVSSPVAPGSPAEINRPNSLQVQIRFNAASAGTRNATLTVTSEGVSPMQVALDGTGTQGTLLVSKTLLNFGDVFLGAKSEMDVMFSNVGTGPITIQTAALAGVGNGFSLIGTPPLNKVLAAGDSLKLLVRFSPPNQGPKSDLLKVTTDSPTDALVTINLSGNGRATTGVDDAAITTGGMSLSLLPITPNPAHDRVEIGYADSERTTDPADDLDHRRSRKNRRRAIQSRGCGEFGGADQHRSRLTAIGRISGDAPVRTEGGVTRKMVVVR